MNNLEKIFNYEGRQVRTIILEGNSPGFIAKDVCEVLDITWSGSKTLASIKDSHKGVVNFTTPGGEQELWYIFSAYLVFILKKTLKRKLVFQKNSRTVP
mgnify:CR=1 FL=1